MRWGWVAGTGLMLLVGLSGPAVSQENLLHEFLQCTKEAPVADRSPCNWFTAKAIQRLWGVKDFQRAGKPGEYLTANEIADFVAGSRCWERLGTAADDETLELAAREANAGLPVVAVYKAQPHGHVALVTRGPVQHSGTWKSNVPMSASFLLDDPQASYVSGPLSKAFGPAKRPAVALYARTRFAPECG
ncbi:MAG TPA: hypothetical protein VEL74_22135 [Thermoanaerobaculia bacterium]|nr:hypothetical protein [Thermoanaerobaculia bacterium]